MFLPYELLRRFFSRQISSNPIFIITFIFLKDYQPCTTVSCVCVCGTAWILMRQFRRSIRALLTNYAYKKNESTKSWSNKQLTAKVTTINQSPIWDFTTSWSVLYNDYFDFKLTVGSSLKLAVMWPFPRDQQNICQPLVFYRFTLLTCHWKTTQPYGQQLYKVNVTCKY